MSKKLCISINLVAMLFGYQMQPHEIVWQLWGGTLLFHPSLENWYNYTQQVSLQKIASIAAQEMYSSLLDVGCGVGTLHNALLKNKCACLYCGVEITPKFIEFAQKKGIQITEGHAESLPCNNNSFDCLVMRHILEHLAHYERSLDEAIRVARREIMIIFFIHPSIHHDSIKLLKAHDGTPFYNNHYNKNKLDSYIRSHEKVVRTDWQRISFEETLLRIYLQ